MKSDEHYIKISFPIFKSIKVCSELKLAITDKFWRVFSSEISFRQQLLQEYMLEQSWNDPATQISILQEKPIISTVSKKLTSYGGPRGDAEKWECRFYEFKEECP